MSGARGGVYVLRHAPSGAFYVGSALNFTRRRTEHLCAIRHGSGGCRRLREFAERAGNCADEFTFAPLLVCAAEDRKMYEDRVLAAWYERPGCLNGMRSGNVHGIEARAKISAKNRGRAPTPEARAKLSATGRGRKASVEARLHMSAAQRGHVGWNKGKPATAKGLAAARLAGMARRGIPVSAEVRAKMAAARVGRRLTAEHKAKIGNALRGRRLSPETRARMSEAWKLRAPSWHPSPEQCAAISARQAGKVRGPYRRRP